MIFISPLNHRRTPITCSVTVGANQIRYESALADLSTAEHLANFCVS